VLLCTGITARAGSGVPPTWKEAARDPKAWEKAREALLWDRAVGLYADRVPLALALLREPGEGNAPPPTEPLARLAVLAAPQDPRTHWALARAAAREGAWGRAIRAGWGALTAGIADPWVLGQTAARLFMGACVAGWVTLLGVFAWGVVARGGPWYHDYADVFPWRMRRLTPLALGVFLVASAWAAGIGPGALLGAFAVTLIPYLPSRGRILLGVVLVAAFALPGALALRAVTAVPESRGWGFYILAKGAGEADLPGSVDALWSRDEAGWFVRHVLARRAGRWAEAVRYGESALEEGGDPGPWHLELGNLAFFRGRYEEAARHYETAAAADPDDPRIWFNLHLTYLALLELNRADEALERARRIDRDAVERFQTTGLRPVPATVEFPIHWVVAELVGPTPEKTAWTKRLTRLLFWPWEGIPAWPLGVLGLLVALFAAKRPKGRRSHRCPGCGTVVCPRCGYRVRGSLLCAACWAVQNQGDLDAAERERVRVLSRAWRRRARRWERLGVALLPGWGSFLARGGARAAVLGAVWSLSVGVAVACAWVPVPWLPWGGDRWILAGLGAVATLSHLTALSWALKWKGGWA